MLAKLFPTAISMAIKSPVLGPYWVESVAHKCHLLNYSYLSSWGYTFVYIGLSKDIIQIDIIQIVSSLPSIDMEYGYFRYLCQKDVF